MNRPVSVRRYHTMHYIGFQQAMLAKFDKYLGESVDIPTTQKLHAYDGF